MCDREPAGRLPAKQLLMDLLELASVLTPEAALIAATTAKVKLLHQQLTRERRWGTRD